MENVIDASGNNHEQQIVYNPVQGEYFLVWVNEVDTTPFYGVIGQRLSETGQSLGTFAYFVGSQQKGNPIVIYNPQMNIYVVLLEFNNGTQDQVVSFSVSPNGAPYDGNLYLIADFPGQNNFPVISYNPISNTFVFACENDLLDNNTGIITSSIVVRVLDGTGVPLFPFADILEGVDMNSNPHISFNPVTSEYVMAASLSEYPGSPFRDIFAFIINGNGVINTTGYAIAAAVGNNNTRLNCHAPQLIWAPQNFYYLLIFQLDLDGPQQLVTDIVFTPVDPVNLISLAFISVGSNLQRNRNAFVTYASRTNDFLIAMDSDNPGSGVSNIYGSIVAAYTGIVTSNITWVNQISHNDHHGRSAYSSNYGQFFVVWNNGTELEDNSTKRYIPNQQPKFVEEMKTNVRFSSSESRTFENKRIPSPIKTINVENEYPSFSKRQTGTNFLKSLLVCSPSSGLIASPINAAVSSPGGPNKVALIASLVTIFGVLAIVGIALIFFLVILPRRRARSVAMMKFDPDRE